MDNQQVESLLDEVQMMERLALSQFTISSANGKAPWHWSLERWLHVATFAGVVIGFIWIAGGEWNSLRDGQEVFRRTLEDIGRDLDALAAAVQRFHGGGQ